MFFILKMEDPTQGQNTSEIFEELLMRNSEILKESKGLLPLPSQF